MSPYLFAITDPIEQEVKLTQNCYHYHIKIAHPDIEDVVIIRRIIESPNLIARDAIDKNRLVSYQEYQQNPQRWYKVVVESGEIVTAYRVGRLKKGEEEIWRR